MLILDSEGLILCVNKKVEALFGYRREELNDQYAELLIPGEFWKRRRLHRREFVADSNFRPMGTDINCFGRRKDGSRFFADISLNPMTLESVHLVIASIRDATHHAKIQKLLAKKVAQLEAINEIGLAISSSKDLDSLLRLIVEEAALLIEVESCSVLLPDDTGELVFRASIDDIVGMRVPVGKGVVSTVLQSGKPKIVNDLSASPQYYRKIAEEGNFLIRSLVVVPLLVEGKSIGVLTAVNKIDGKFTEADCDLLSTIGSYAAASLHSAQLYDQIQQHAGELGREVAKRTQALRESQLTLQQRNLELNRLYRALEPLFFTSAPVLEKVAETIVETVLTEFGKSNCSLLVAGPEKNGIKRVAVSGPYADEVSKGMLKMDGPGLVPRAFRSGEIVNVPDVRKDPDYVPNWQAARSELAIPLKKGDQVIAVIDVQSTELYAFGHEDERLIKIFAERAALALENVRLFEAERHRRIEAETLRQASAVVAASLNQDEAIDEILVQLARVVPYDSASVQLLFDGYLEIVGGRGWPDPGEILGLRFPVPGDNPYSEVVQRREALILDEAGRKYAHFLQAPHDHICSWLGVPLIVREKVVGMLAIDHTQPNYYSSEHIRVANAFADQVAITIDNTRLFDRTQSTLAETQMLYRIARTLIHAESLPVLLKSLVDSVAVFLPADSVALAIVDLKAQKIAQTARGGAGSEDIVEIDFDELMDGISGWVLLESKPALSPKDTPDPRESEAVQIRRLETGCGSVIVVPLIYRDRVFGTITAMNRLDQADFTQHEVDVLEAIANQAAIAIENVRLFEEIQWLATTDDLTGIHNRRHFFDLGRVEIERASRYGHPLSAIMLDIDFFKKVNDTYGHGVGDQVLRALAHECLGSIREFDILGRYGGEEFALVLPETDRFEARKIAERLRQRIQDKPIKTTHGELSFTISLGVAEMNGNASDLAALLDFADSALYEAKQAGRNCVRVCE